MYQRPQVARLGTVRELTMSAYGDVLDKCTIDGCYWVYGRPNVHFPQSPSCS